MEQTAKEQLILIGALWGLGWIGLIGAAMFFLHRRDNPRASRCKNCKSTALWNKEHKCHECINCSWTSIQEKS